MEVNPVNMRDPSEIERGVAAFAHAPNGGMIVTALGAATLHRELIITLASRHKLPAIYFERLFVAAGGLVSYGPNRIDLYRQAAVYVDRILRGEKRADLPVQAPTNYVLAINLKTANTLRLTVPPTAPRPRRRGDRMRRREVMAGLAAASVAWPLVPHAQQTGKIFRIGMVEPVSAELNAAYLAAFRQGLQDLGYIEGQNLVLEHRSADGDASRFPALVSELIALNVDLLFARGTPAALAAKKATITIPVVMAVGEPLLVVTSLARPGGNITGFSGVQPELETKRLELTQGDGTRNLRRRGLAQYEQSRDRPAARRR